jgi:hypothetical protein
LRFPKKKALPGLALSDLSFKDFEPDRLPAAEPPPEVPPPPDAGVAASGVIVLSGAEEAPEAAAVAGPATHRAAAITAITIGHLRLPIRRVFALRLIKILSFRLRG